MAKDGELRTEGGRGWAEREEAKGGGWERGGGVERARNRGRRLAGGGAGNGARQRATREGTRAQVV